MRRTPIILTALCLLASLWATHRACADHPLEIERLTYEGKHLEAVLGYFKIPERVRTVSVSLAAAKSALALSDFALVRTITDDAQRQWGRGTGSETQDARARLSFTRAIAEFQDQQYEHSVEHVQGALRDGAHDQRLTGALWVLWGDALYRKGELVSALQKFQDADRLIGDGDGGEIAARIGQTHARLSQWEEALAAYQRVPVDSDRAPDALRALISINYSLGRHEEVRTWAMKGMEDYPEAFLDGSSEYFLVMGALARGGVEEAQERYAKIQQRYPVHDVWMVLIRGALERAQWNGHPLAAHKKEGA